MNKVRMVLFFGVIFFLFAQPALARSGCCSQHGGVMSNGCGCNDGTPLSNICAPYYACTAGSAQPETVRTVLPTPTPYFKPIAKPFLTKTPTKAPVKINKRIPTKTPTPTMTPTSTLAPTINPRTQTTPTPKPSGFWGFLFSLFGMQDK